MASIKQYKTASGKRWRVQYTSPDGKRRGKRGFLNRDQAEQWASQFIVERSEGTWVSPEKKATKISELWPGWIERKQRKGLKPASIARLKSTWNTHVEPEWGAVAVSNITPQGVQDWVDKLAGHRKGTAARPAHALLSSLLDDATRLQMIKTTNPCAKTELPAKPKKEMHVLTPAQAKLFLKEVKRFKSLCAFLLFVGPRFGEAAALSVEDIKVLAKRARINKTVQRLNGEIVWGPPKNGVERWAAIPDQVLKMMEPDLKGKLPSALVWSNLDGTPVTVPSRRSWFHSAVDRCRDIDPTFPPITPHDLRHTAVSMMLSNGATIAQVQNQVGHASPKITLDVYTHLMPDDVAALGARLNSIAADVVKNESSAS